MSIIASNRIITYLYRYVCFLQKRTQSVEEQNHLLLQKVKTVAEEKLKIQQEKQILEGENQRLDLRAKDLQAQASMAREEAERQAKFAKELSEEKRQKEELKSLEDKLRQEKQWGESYSAGRPILMVFGGALAGPLGFTVAALGGYAYELAVNRKKHLNEEYFKDLFATQEKVKKLAQALGAPYPKDLEEAWWNQRQSWIGGLLGRDFGFQHRYQT